MEISNLDLIQAFRQGQVDLEEGGNCASIALIKASIEIFGLEGVFNLRKEQETYHVAFKNGSSVSFTQGELTRSIAAAGFVDQSNDFPDKKELYSRIYNYATICFCAMVKKVVEMGEAGEGKGDFEAALRALNDGAITDNIPVLLGLDNHYSGPGVFRANKPGMLGWFRAHTVYISHGLYDNRGNPRKVFFMYPKRIRIHQ